MKILFAVSNDNITTSVVSKYQQKYKEIITSKNVYYFNAIIKELQRDKNYDAVVIGEDLEPISNNNYEAIDKFLFEKLDSISDEASKPTGEDIPIILICSDRRTQSDQLLIKLFGIGIYNAVIGNDRSIVTVCNLINKPRNKKEAKLYYRVDSDDVSYEKENDQDVSENEIRSILSHYKKIGSNVRKCVESFDSIADQYTETQLRIIIKFLTNETKSILEANSAKYQKLMSKGTVLSNGQYATYKQQDPKKPGSLDVLTKDLQKTNLSKPVIIPSTIDISKNIVSSKPASQQSGIRTISVPQQNIQPAVNNQMRSVSNQMTQNIQPNYNQGIPTNNQIAQNIEPEVVKPVEETAKMNDTLMNTNNSGINQMNNVPISEEEIMQENMESINEQKRGRGRPKKNSEMNPVQAVVPQPVQSIDNSESKKRRGRPPKQQTALSPIEPIAPVSAEMSVAPVVPIEPIVPMATIEPLGNNNQDLKSNETDGNSFSLDSNVTPSNANEQAPILSGFENDLESNNINNNEPVNLFGLDNSNSANNTENKEANLFDMNNNSTQNNNGMNPYGQPSNPMDMNANPYGQPSNPMDMNANPYGQPSNPMDMNANPYEQTSNPMDMNVNPYGQPSNPMDMNANPYGQPSNPMDVNADPYGQINNPMNMNADPYGQPSNPMNMNADLYGQQNQASQPNTNFNQFGQAENYNNNSQYNDLISTNQTQNVSNNAIAGNGKIVSFVGTSKNGTSFIVNNLAQLLAQNGVRTAILDLTKNKNAYYMFTNNDGNLVKIASESISNLSKGKASGINVEKNLTVYTSLPDENNQSNNIDTILNTLSGNYEVTLLDCDFDTENDYFAKANEIYLIQSMDTFTIQPLTQFLSDLKLKNILDENKLRIVLNKYVKLRKLDERMIIGGMAKYNEPSMTLQRDLFNPQTIRYTKIPFEMETYARYLDEIAMCELSLNGYSQNLIAALDELKNMVYPLVGGSNMNSGYTAPSYTEEKRGLFGGKKAKKQEVPTQFSNNVNDTLNKMRTTNNF